MLRNANLQPLRLKTNRKSEMHRTTKHTVVTLWVELLYLSITDSGFEDLSSTTFLDKLAMRYNLICLIVASLIIPSQCMKHSPCYHVVLDLPTWLDIVRNDQRTIMDYGSIMDYDVKPSICSIKRAKLDERCEPLLRKVSCDVQHARWDYKVEVVQFL